MIGAKKKYQMGVLDLLPNQMDIAGSWLGPVMWVNWIFHRALILKAFSFRFFWVYHAIAKNIRVISRNCLKFYKSFIKNCTKRFHNIPIYLNITFKPINLKLLYNMLKKIEKKIEGLRKTKYFWIMWDIYKGTKAFDNFLSFDEKKISIVSNP